jgi:hypothetical protein
MIYFAIDIKVLFVCLKKKTTNKLGRIGHTCKKLSKYKKLRSKKTDWKNKNLCMHKGLQFEKM